MITQGNLPNMILWETYKQGVEKKEEGNEFPVPKVGMTFLTEKDMRDYCTKYAESVGYDVAERSTNYGDDGKQRNFSLSCSKSGHEIFNGNNPFYTRSSTKTNCKSKINIAMKDDDVFTINRVFLSHNHDLTPGKTRYFRYKPVFKRANVVKRKLDLNEEENEEKKQKSSGEEEGTRKPQLERGDVEVLVNFFSVLQTRDPSFFYTIDVDEDGRIKNMFWADSRCRAAYESFPDVVTFDTTYLTSHYNLPLVSFFGVNHHGQSILFGCGLIFTEDTKTFIWLLKSWLMCMHGHHPKTLVSDDEGKPVQSAISQVFPDSHNILCPSHISYMNSVFTAGLISQKVAIAIAKEFFDVFVNPKTTLKQFVDQYEKALEKNIEKEKNADFASSSFVLPTMTNHPIEKQLQKVYTNDIFKQFQEEWRGLIFCNASLSRLDGSILTFEVAESVYNNEDGMFLKELTCDVVFKESENQINCSCCLFESKGILCRHIISVLIKRNKHDVPTCYILDRWRKDIKRKYKDEILIKDYMCCSNNIDHVSKERRWYDELSPLLFDVQKLGAQSKEQCEILQKVLKEVKKKLLQIDI